MISLTSVLQYLMKTILLLLFLITSVLSKNSLDTHNYPNIYAQLGTPLFIQVNNFQGLSNSPLLRFDKADTQHYVTKVQLAIKHGHHIDKQASNNAKEIKSYLQELRQIQRLHDKIEKSYKQQLYKSIHDKNQDIFFALTNVPLSSISSDPRLKEKVVQYYKALKKSDKTPIDKVYNVVYLETLSKDFQLDQSSYAYINTMFKTFQNNQAVQERKSLNSFHPNPHAKNPVQVISIRTKNGFDLYLENHAYYDVSIQLNALKLVNLSSSKRFPFIGSFPAKSRTKILHFSIQNPQKESFFQTRYSSTIGRLSPDYDRKFVYALPYERGKAYQLTQGFNGEHTHKGQSAYALDFQMKEGTKVHAMRKGRVVSFEDHHTEHGFSPEFTNKSNYIIVQHNDGTMAMYGHLKPHGVKVRLGQKVYKHTLIGLSGNTGYSSGPHLHVHISAIQSLHSGSRSVPFSFLTQRGKIDSPEVDSFYIAK